MAFNPTSQLGAGQLGSLQLGGAPALSSGSGDSGDDGAGFFFSMPGAPMYLAFQFFRSLGSLDPASGSGDEAAAGES